MDKLSFAIGGLDCMDCVEHLRESLERLDGVERAGIIFSTGRATVEVGPNGPDLEAVRAVIEGAGYRMLRSRARASDQGVAWRWPLARIIIVGALLLVAWQGPSLEPSWFAIAATLLGGHPVVLQGIAAVRRGRIDVETFLSLGIIGSCLVGEFLAAGAIAFFVGIGELLESLTSDRSRRAIRDLVSAAPEEALVRSDGEWESRPATTLRPGDIILVRPGERIAADGCIVDGAGAVDEAPITGEPLPLDKTVGDTVFAGTISSSGALQVRVERTGEDTTLGRIIQMVEEAQEHKAPVQRLADRFVTYFTPIVLVTAATAGIVTGNVMIAIAVIVVACPCAVALATPLAVVAGIGYASRRGILVKGGLHLENLGRVDTVAFDKTGTLTRGRPRVTDVVSLNGVPRADVLRMAALAESRSDHPIARAILAHARQEGLEPGEPAEFRAESGRGVVVNESDQPIAIGTAGFLESLGMPVGRLGREDKETRERHGDTVLYVGSGRETVGYIAVADEVRPDARDALARLRRSGVGQLVMLSGDNARTAATVAQDLGFDDYRARMLPEDKVAYIETLRGDHYVAMIGDGVNDAPALAVADVGIAMGAAGTDAAIEAADVALMTDDLTRIAEAVDIGRRTFRTIRQNLVIAICFNIIGISLAAGGFLSPPAAAATHVLPDVFVFANSARLIMAVHARR